MSDFADSPRASKRRRTTTYGPERSILEEKQNSNGTTPGSYKTRKRKSITRNESSPTSDTVLQGVTGAEDEQSMTISPIVSKKRTPKGARRKSKETQSEPSLTNGYHAVSLSAEQQDAQIEQEDDGVITKDKDITPLEQDDTAMDSDEDNSTPRPRSSGRQRTRTRRFSISPEKPKPIPPVSTASTGSQKKTKRILEDEASPTKTMPKGILTPSKNRVGRPRKSVIFDKEEKDIEERFGFKDIDESVPRSKTPKSQTKQSPSRKRHKVNTATTNDEVLDITPQVFIDTIMLEDLADNTIEDTMDLDTIAIPTPIISPTIDLNADSSSSISSPSLLKIKSTILSRLSGAPSRLTSLQDPNSYIPSHHRTNYTTLYTLLHATITTSESNSLLLLGRRGSGKSHLLNLALSSLLATHSPDFHIVRLDGFFQTDDKLALREIWRQLGREMNVDERETNEIAGSYADTMSSLLSLLSHPDEFAPIFSHDDLAFNTDGTIDPNLLTTTSPIEPAVSTTTTNGPSKSIIFHLSNFDLFTTHPRQTLLYNLFDIAQSRKAPIAVIGESARMDVVECLEKRVKSRFSHRWVHVRGPGNVSGFRGCLVGEDQGEDGVEGIRGGGGGVLCVDEEEEDDDDDEDDGDEDERNVRRSWNEYIRTTFISSPAIKQLIERSFYTAKSLPDLFMALYEPIAMLELPATLSSPPRVSTSTIHNRSPNTNTTTTLVQDAPSITTMIPTPPSILSLLTSLPTLHLSLLIAASRLDTIHNIPALNFSLAYDQYRDLVTRTKLQHSAAGAVTVGGGAGFRLWGKEMAKVAWEALGEWELLVPVSGTGREGGGADAVGGEGANVRMWRVDVTLEDLSWALKSENRIDGAGGAGGGLDVLQKWCREV